MKDNRPLTLRRDRRSSKSSHTKKQQ